MASNATLVSSASAPSTTNTVSGLPLPVSGPPTSWSSTSEIGSTLHGTGDNDQLAGNAADITLVGGAGDDSYFVWDHTNIVVEEAGGGIDTISTYGVHGYSLASAANVENLTLLGGQASSARGNSLSNVITGNDAINMIDGGAADDVLTGGGGRDTFVIRQGDGSDVITDFLAGQRGDTVDLSGFDFAKKLDRGMVLVQRHFAHRRRDDRFAAITANEFRHCFGAAALERYDFKPLQVLSHFRRH